MHTQPEEGPTHAYLLLKPTMNRTNWNTFYTWFMQYQYDTPFLITVQHSVKMNIDVWQFFNYFIQETHLHFKAYPSSVQNYLSSKWLVTVDRNTDHLEQEACVLSLSWRYSRVYIQVY
jgi:hypothetical protein